MINVGQLILFLLKPIERVLFIIRFKNNVVPKITSFNFVKARIIDLENKLQQVQTISTAIAEGTDGELDIDQIDPSLIARKEEKAEASYHERLMAILSN